MSSEEKNIENMSNEEIKRSISEEEDEELDEFGRVKRRRQKFKNERSDNTEEEGEERGRSRHRRRHRSASSSRSPRRHRRRRYSDDSDSDYDDYHRRRRSNSRHRHHRRHQRYHHKNGADLYSEAAQYIDTEFYPTKIYIGDLENVSQNQLESIFSRFGALESVRLVEGKDYGFVTFEKKEAALAAIQNMHGALVGSRHIKVNRAKIPERNKVGFGNVPWQDEDGLMAKEVASYTTKPTSLGDPPITGRVLTSYDDL